MPPKRPSEDDHEDSRAEKRSFAASDYIIVVTVGPEKVRHLVHESVLCRSPFFNKCLHSGMREQEEKAISLPEDDPGVFAIIVDWLYSDRISEKLDLQCMLRAYNTARKFCMPNLQNALVDSFRSKMISSSLSPLWVLYVWENTIEGCQLRKLVLDVFYYDISKSPSPYKKQTAGAEGGKNFATQMEWIMTETQLGLELFWRFADPADRPSKNLFKMKGCQYHVHEDGMKCT